MTFASHCEGVKRPKQSHDQIPSATPRNDRKKTNMESQPNNPLHGVKLATIVEELQMYYGWEGLAERININCFKSNPTIKSSLKFLRKTPWAREKVERLYLKTSFN